MNNHCNQPKITNVNRIYIPMAIFYCTARGIPLDNIKANRKIKHHKKKYGLVEKEQITFPFL